ncbi:hypothetical protein DM02DRAFT_725505 [Periconia macrospinosa]|uniref:Uncharacterized protein n=1 Tax=Periconia macrospinosa TaxID=97972 RepID=A0A2V1E2Q5_9PLEO|nr:hypothetical protein DM02DRAFT_725505 [Periconia macrospinosa]
MDPSIKPEETPPQVATQDQKPTIDLCSIDKDGKMSRFHLLSCGHIVAIFGANWACGLNCMRATQPPFQDSIGCEICLGLPMSSFYMSTRDYSLRHALAMTGHVITSWAGHDYTEFDMATLHHPLADPKSTHRLSCNHLVDCGAPRDCGANCNREPPCPGFAGSEENHQSDAIICRECVSRADLVYSRYLSVPGGLVRERVAQHGILGSANSSTHTTQNGADTPQYALAAGAPQGSVTESNANSTSSGAFAENALQNTTTTTPPRPPQVSMMMAPTKEPKEAMKTPQIINEPPGRFPVHTRLFDRNRCSHSSITSSRANTLVTLADILVRAQLYKHIPRRRPFAPPTAYLLLLLSPAKNFKPDLLSGQLRPTPQLQVQALPKTEISYR